MVERIGLVVHGGKATAIAAADVVRGWARDNGVECHDIDVWRDADDARLSVAEEVARGHRPDLVVTVGGDGTLLRGVRVAIACDAAVLGVDVGRVGFLTDVAVPELREGLDAVHAGMSRVDARLALTMRSSRPLDVPSDLQSLLRYGRGPAPPPPPVDHASDPDRVGWGVPLDVVALNDIVLEKLARDRQASLAVYVNGRVFAYYSADALIVASSTGSTAYSFAAGGPVVAPELDALVFTPVAAHMVFNRSLVLSARDQHVGIRLLDGSGQVAVSIDGQLRGVLDPGDGVVVYAAARRARLVRVGDTDFFHRVRERFGLTDSAAALADGSSPDFWSPSIPEPADLARPGPPDLH